jgi:hypothetical protein
LTRFSRHWLGVGRVGDERGVDLIWPGWRDDHGPSGSFRCTERDDRSRSIPPVEERRRLQDRLRLKGGRFLRYTGRTTNDVWAGVAGAFGVPMATFGDPKHSQGPLPGLYG